MAAFFAQVLRASLYGGILIGAVCLLRLLLKGAPRRLTCLLWLLVGLRLLLPFEIESDFSLQPGMAELPLGYYAEQPVQVPNLTAQNPEDTSDKTLDPAVTGDHLQRDSYLYNEQGGSVAEPVSYGQIAAGIWLLGMATMGLYSLTAYLRLKRKIRSSIVLEEGIWFCPGLDTAFVLGLARPQIYLNGLGEEEMGFVVAHEKAHIARKDHWWKFLGYVALAIHWFNPLVWLGYVLLCRDLEMACDEAVIRSLDLPQRKAYSQALLSCAARHSLIGACPVAFGEVSVRERITSVMNYKKPKFWIRLVAILAVMVAAVCFLTVPSAEDEEIAARLGGNVFTWEKKYADVFSFEIELDEDGTCYFVDGVDPAYMGLGAWWVKDGQLKIRDDGAEKYRYFYFRVDGDDLVYLADKSAAFSYTDVADGDRFYRVEDIGNAEERLAQCKEIFETWAGYENYYLSRYDWNGGAALTSTYEANYWRAGDDRLYTWNNPEVDGFNGGSILVKDGVGYHTIYQATNDTKLSTNPEWSVITNPGDMGTEGNWFETFIWENANIQYVRTDIINGNKERVTLTVLEDPSFFGRNCPYTVHFYFACDGAPVYLSMVLDENKGEHDWIRTVSTNIMQETLDADAQIDAVYTEYLESIGKNGGFSRVKCEDADCTDYTHDHSARDCVDPNCNIQSHQHNNYDIACTVEHCDDPSHGHGGHDHY